MTNGMKLELPRAHCLVAAPIRSLGKSAADEH
jgi:hypothetical protein